MQPVLLKVLHQFCLLLLAQTQSLSLRSWQFKRRDWHAVSEHRWPEWSDRGAEGNWQRGGYGEMEKVEKEVQRQRLMVLTWKRAKRTQRWKALHCDRFSLHAFIPSTSALRVKCLGIPHQKNLLFYLHDITSKYSFQ